MAAESGESELVRLEPLLVNGMPDLLDELEKGFLDVSGDYATFMSSRREVVLAAAEAAVHTLVRIAERVMDEGAGSVEDWVGDLQRGLFEEIGRIQWREGIAVETLLSAYQVGARLTWRHMSERALAAGVTAAALAALAESVFCFVDQLSSASTAGYLAEQREAAAVRDRYREELVDLLLSDRADIASVRLAATHAGWPIPPTAAVIFVDPENPAARTVLARLEQTGLPVRRDGVLGAIVPDPSSAGRRQQLITQLAGASAVIGHTVPLEQLPASAQIAEVAVRLQRAGVLTDDPVFTDEHLDAILVHRDPRMLDALRRRALAPLEDAPTGSRELLRETLRSWLRNMGDRRAIAAELHVHPQTVRYRIGRLREIFGDRLDDPDERMKLTLALGWDRHL